jgi:Tfp pilus assembly protein PilF
MPPEQAVGAVGKVDRRSDVFGLGAVLAVILTGRPPFAAGSAETVRVQSAQGKLDECFARLDGCGADPELVALCKRCLAPSPADRPAGAGEVARAVGALRAEADERARRAELERVKAEGEKIAAELRATAQRKRRRVQLALAGTVLLLLMSGLNIGWWAREQHARDTEAVAILLDQCEQALRSGDAAAAAVTLQAAQGRAEGRGVESQAGRLARCHEDLAVLRDLDAVDQVRWTTLEGKWPEVAAVATRYHEALGRFGADPDAVGAEEATARVSGSAVRERLVAALDRLLRAERSVAVRAALESLDPDSFRDAIRDAERDNDAAALEKLAGQAEALIQLPGFAAFLGESNAISPERARAVLGTAMQRRPGELGLLMALGLSYPINQREGADERVRWGQAAVAVAPTNWAAHNQVGIALYDKNDLDEAMVEYREAIRLDPKLSLPHNNLGLALYGKNDLDGAMAEYREAIRLDPKFAWPHYNLGLALKDKNDLDGAMVEYREAIRLDPKFAALHNDLGIALYGKNDLDAAIAEYRKAIRLDPKYAMPHINLGLALKGKNDLDGAMAEYRESIRLDPKYAMPHSNLGLVLMKKGNLEGAVAEYKETLRIDPKHSLALSNLPRAERMRTLLPRLPDILDRKAEPQTPDEACWFAQLCGEQFQQRYAAAARLYERAFVADGRLADDLAAGHRYNAACYAARAERGDGVDTPANPAEREALRGKALAWLGADLTLCKRQAASAVAADRAAAGAKLNRWLGDTDLSGVRDPKPLAKLPAAERENWEKFWADVKATLADARKPAPPLGKDAGKK